MELGKDSKKKGKRERRGTLPKIFEKLRNYLNFWKKVYNKFY